jgi:hypothetical protein
LRSPTICRNTRNFLPDPKPPEHKPDSSDGNDH